MQLESSSSYVLNLWIPHYGYGGIRKNDVMYIYIHICSIDGFTHATKAIYSFLFCFSRTEKDEKTLKKNLVILLQEEREEKKFYR